MSLDDLVSNDGVRGGSRRAGRGQKRRSPPPGADNTIRVGRRVYVGNLSWKTSWQDLKDHFKQCGTVVYADVMREGGSGGRSRGCGIVEFEAAEEAAEAINTLNDVELDGRPLFIREDREDRDLEQNGGNVTRYRPQPQQQPQQHHMDFNAQQQQPQISKRSRGIVGAAGRASPHGEIAAVGRRCYVMNLAWETTWQTLKDHFRQVGNVVYAEVLSEASGRSRGCGIVEFEHAEEALKAISTLSNSNLDGRSILVREDREDRDLRGGKPVASSGKFGGAGGAGGRGAAGGASQGTTVMVQNLPWSVSWQGLKDLFRAAGSVTRADVALDDSSRSKGWGTVTFGTPAEADNAIQMFNGTELEGRSITCRKYT
eukprot:CAMPEP_0118932430 /NCGR_PEP_ID=MMETSP1169-20130426/10209_1 /TAXON_ID=36882 /ORGANISM="Pyramimonas obovata, Strain CCMP722" /LENGTH=370 /DNA_ID=CAMNT_0006875087 /DNA_START=76 /DNA_END=1188 /DNA_ORIENTATION=-